jgi:hypothetical protein
MKYENPYPIESVTVEFVAIQHGWKNYIWSVLYQREPKYRRGN